ncbi:kinase-like domain-containing protein, partial [Mycena leptocephala]
QRLRREVDVWSRLKHKNILPFIGVCDDLAPSPVLISPFYKFGHVGTYLKKNPFGNREELVRGIAAGLEFLHANNIIHGDLKVQNVLVDKQGTPRICDFGISKIINRRGFTMSNVGTAPYMAPELFSSLMEESPSTTKSSDAYSYTLLVLEVRNQQTHRDQSNSRGASPKREDYDINSVKNQTWAVLDRCWSFEPQLRPPISEVLHELTASFLAGSLDLMGGQQENFLYPFIPYIPYTFVPYPLIP